MKPRAIIEGVSLRTGMFLCCFMLGLQAITKPREVAQHILPAALAMQRKYPFRWRYLIWPFPVPRWWPWRSR